MEYAVCTNQLMVILCSILSKLRKQACQYLCLFGPHNQTVIFNPIPCHKKERDVEELIEACFNYSAPLPAKGVLHKGVQLTIGIKFNEGN